MTTHGRRSARHEGPIAGPGQGASERVDYFGGFDRLFVAGTVLFSGSLYALALSGARGLGAITPLGGVAFLAGWLALAWAALRG